MTYAQAPWRVHGTVLKDAAGNSIASGGNNRAITGEVLQDSLQLAAAAPDLLKALRDAVNMINALNSAYGGDTMARSMLRNRVAKAGSAAIARATGT